MDEKDQDQGTADTAIGTAASTLGGAAAGAVAGTALGVPVVGTVIGALSGAAISAAKKANYAEGEDDAEKEDLNHQIDKTKSKVDECSQSFQTHG